ncbi:hypothetical protein BC830DRAFT_1139896 [Chytriomyces sp. MP71]|nr:hypothetical protein BC830DRAFT_1139896 [Chytriomyces sp. MP71]
MWKLEPWVHYVPVEVDLSDLDERIQWLRKNDKAARQISLNAQKFIKGVNTISAMQCYSGLVFLEYSRLYR